MKLRGQSALALGLTGLLLLTGCAGTGDSPKTQMQSAQAVYRSISGCTGQAEITADYGQRVYGYTADLTVQGDSGVMTVTQPENIAGTVLTWSGEEGGLEYDQTELDTGPLSDTGLSPADAMPAILKACQGGAITDCCMDTLAEQDVLYATLDTDGDGGTQIACWFRPEDFGLLRAEVSQDGVTVITMVFSEFSFTFPEGEEKEGGQS